ncbi:NAD(P)-dependent oxidoreductase [Dyadobacter sp. 3J3]|uniref:NAD(P)-dependent oxidoreductase n=1 Tax=Dyadobacter sp. 3J3 TaxID=2606600 RepID=UPI001E37D2A6|nr:NAD(P)-binding oxidoreductase [Dyadobacter sp. 3J3]
MNKKILILGATGRTGNLLLRQLLDRGYQVNVLIRDKERMVMHQNMSVFEGTPTDEKALEKAIDGCDVIISVLNISRTCDFPWASLRTQPDFLSHTLSNVIRLGTGIGVKRIIILSAWGVGDTKSDIPWWFKWLIDYSNIGVAYRDHEQQEKLLVDSGMDYTIIRPVGLVNSETEKNVLVSLNNYPKPGLTISRKNVARFIISVLENDCYINQKPVIYTK